MVHQYQLILDENKSTVIMRILAGEANAKDMLELNDWISQDEKNRIKFKQLMGYWNMSAEIAGAEKPEVSFEKFSQRIATPEVKKKSLKLWALPLAASFALLVIGTFLMHSFLKDKLAVEYITYTCQNGNYHLTLPDSTTVYLNKDSRITYSSRYGKDNREIEMQGEAYFDVTKNENLFSLRIANTNATIEVLGTRFNVQAYDDESEIVTTLEEGSIVFKDGKQQVVIAPDQQLSYNKNASVVHLREIDTDLYTAWKDNVYRYERIHLQELCKELENIFNEKITVSQKLKDIKVSGSFAYQQSIEEILNSMGKSIPFKWSRNKNEILIN